VSVQANHSSTDCTAVERSFKEQTLVGSPYTIKYNFVIFDAYLRYADEPFMAEGVAKKFTLTIENRLFIQQNIRLKLHLPDGFEAFPAKHMTFSLEQYHCNIRSVFYAFSITKFGLAQSENASPSYEFLLGISGIKGNTRSGYFAKKC
jgi:hypothetical protein